MSITYPRTDILTGLKFAPQSSFRLQMRQEFSKDEAGQTHVKDIGPPLWVAKYQTHPMSLSDAHALETDLQTLDGGINLFEGWHPLRPLPLSNQQTALGGVVVNAINVDRTEMKLSGLPNGFVLTKTDWMSIDDGVNLHLCRLAETVIADGTGLTPYFEVRPAIRQNVAATQPVVLRYATARFALAANSVVVSPAGSPNLASVSFTALQAFL